MLAKALAHLRRDERGQAAVEFMLVAGLMVWFMLQPVYGWMVLTKYDQLRAVQQTYLVQLQVNGELTTADYQALDQKLASYGFNPAQASFTDSTPANTFVSRGNGVSLDIGYPLATLVPQFWTLNGQNPQTVQDSWASGTAVSEAP